jgi:hypothetical protein
LINDAYEVLSSAAARERYDSTRIDIIDKLKWKNEVRSVCSYFAARCV